MGKEFKNKVKKFLISLVIFMLLLLVIIIIHPYKYDEIIGQQHLNCSFQHFFGTDYLGRDFFLRVCLATLITLFISILSIFCSIFIGSIYGIYAGYKGGTTEKIMLMILNILESIPDFLLAIILLIVFNNLFISGSLIGIFLTLILISWTQMARIIINETKKIKELEYIQYAQLKGAKFKHILFFHLIPNLKDIIIIPSYIFLESFLSFIGIGIQTPLPSLGRMISEGIKYFRLYFSELLIPSIVLILIILFFNFFGESMLNKNNGDNYE